MDKNAGGIWYDRALLSEIKNVIGTFKLKCVIYYIML